MDGLVRGHGRVSGKFRFAFTSSHIHLTGDIALERVTSTVVIWPGVDASKMEDVGKGLHVYGRQSDGSWKLTHDIWNSDLDAPSGFVIC